MINDRRSLRGQLDGEAGLMRKHEAMWLQAEDAIRETYKRRFGGPVEVQFYRMVTKKRRKKPAE